MLCLKVVIFIYFKEARLFLNDFNKIVTKRCVATFVATRAYFNGKKDPVQTQLVRSVIYIYICILNCTIQIRLLPDEWQSVDILCRL